MMKKMKIKYSWVLDVYIFLFPMKFKEEELVIYDSLVWSIYHRQRTYQPYYYFIYHKKIGVFDFRTGIAEESELKKVPPVLAEFY